jgi:predicted kinase
VNFSRLFSSRVQPNPVADELRSLLVAERMRNDELMRTIVEMRREGFQAPPPQAELSPEGYGLPEGVMAAIEQRAPTRQAREHLMQEARKLLRKGDEGEVAEAILQGEGFAW